MWRRAYVISNAGTSCAKYPLFEYVVLLLQQKVCKREVLIKVIGRKPKPLPKARPQKRKADLEAEKPKPKKKKIGFFLFKRKSESLQVLYHAGS